MNMSGGGGGGVCVGLSSVHSTQMNMSGGGGGVCRSVKCPQHTDEQRQAVRSSLLWSVTVVLFCVSSVLTVYIYLSLRYQSVVYLASVRADCTNAS